MLKNPLMEQLRAQISSDDKAQMDESFAIADRIHFLLEKHNLTQRQLADKLKKKESEISKWLSGGHNFTIQTLTKIGFAIGERIYNIPQTVKNEDNHFVYDNIILKSTFHREFCHSSINHNLIYQSFAPAEFSELEVNSIGVICHNKSRKQTDEYFIQAHLKPEAFKNIEQIKVI